MGEILNAIFGSNSILATICVSLLPLLELKGGITLGIDEMWGDSALDVWQSFGWALLGSCLVIPVIALLFRPIYNWLKTKKFFKAIISFVIGDVEKRSANMAEENKAKSSRRVFWLKILAVFLFVAFPAPGTGVWTGTCFAVLLGLNFWAICLVAILGNVVCGLIIASLCQVFPQFSRLFLIIFLCLIAIFIVYKLIMHFVKKRRNQNTIEATEANQKVKPTHESNSTEAK